MNLDQYLSGMGITEAQFAELIGVTQPNVNRLRKGQIPGKELMATIFDKTGGAVRADDFFGIGAAA
jgi:predicted XRE-type DNA-binding protein